MSLTRVQRKLKKEAEQIAELTKMDLWNVEDEPSEFRLTALRLTINQMVIAEVVTRYTLLDEILGSLICKYFFSGRGRQPFHFARAWRTKKFSTFVHYIVDEIYLLQKMRLVHAIKPAPSDVWKAVERINAVRNAMAHSFFPENRRQYKKEKKVTYAGKDIRTVDGITALRDDFDLVWKHFARRMYGGWR